MLSLLDSTAPGRWAALSVLGLSLGCGGGHGDGGASVEPPPPGPAAPMAMSCGVINPHLILGCNDGSPDMLVHTVDDTEVALPEGNDGVGSELHAICSTHVDEDPGFKLEASYHAGCQRGEASGDALRYSLIFDTHVARVCGTGPRGSSAQVAPTWKGALTLPDDKSRYRLAVDVTSGGECGCQLLVNGEIADPIFGGTATVFLGFFGGGRSVPVAFVCGDDEFLMQTGCFAYVKGATSGPEGDGELRIDIAVDRCGPAGCPGLPAASALPMDTPARAPVA